MPNYTATNQTATAQAITSSYKSIILHTASTVLRRGKLYDLMVGTLGTPADQTYEWDISRYTSTANMTATVWVALPLDGADAAATSEVRANATGELTYTAVSSLFYIPINQRASYRWVAAPGSELVWPATNGAGIGLRTRSISGGTAVAAAMSLFVE